jgi:NADPH:quinone reductase-like Zn-dependent oxidoreductase
MIITNKQVYYMKAAIIQSYGPPDCFEIRNDLHIPEPLEDDVLIRIKAASVNPIDCKIRRGSYKLFSGFSFPKILGFDFAGTVVAIGNRIESFRVGDAVFGMLDSFHQGSYAQFTVAKQNNLVQMPKNLSFEQCAAVPMAALTAYQGLTLAQIDTEKRVLILGGIGGVGSFAVQIAKAYDCEVTATAGPQNQMLLHKLGADRTLDYTSQSLKDIEGPFDIIFDVHAKYSFNECRHLLAKEAYYITSEPHLKNLGSFAFSSFRSQKSATFLVKANHRDLLTLKRFLEKEMIRPLIDRVYTLEEIRDAHLYSEAGHIQGKIVISIPD